MKPVHLSILIISFLFASACGDPTPAANPAYPGPNADTSSSPEPTEPASPELDKSFEERLDEYESKDRVFWQKPDLVINRLGDLSTQVVADIGAGSGYFARRLAHKAKRVIAIDIDPKFISFMDSIKLVELPSDVQKKFETRLALPDDPKLNPGEADIVLMVNTYLYITDRVSYLRRLKDGLADGGRLVIIDFKKKQIPMNNPPQGLRVPLFQVERELFDAGYSNFVSDDTSLDYQYIVVASK